MASGLCREMRGSSLYNVRNVKSSLGQPIREKVVHGRGLVQRDARVESIQIYIHKRRYCVISVRLSASLLTFKRTIKHEQR